MGDGIREPREVVFEFNITVNSLVDIQTKLAKTIAEKADVDQLKRKLVLARQVGGPEYILQQAGPKLLTYSKEIIDRKEEFFMGLQIKCDKKTDEEFITNLVNSIKTNYAKMRPAEQDIIYNKVKLLLDDYLEYCIGVKRQKISSSD